MKLKTLSNEREKEFKLLRDRINSLELQDSFVVEQWINRLYAELRKQDKQFIKEILDLRDLESYGGYSPIEKMINKIKQKADVEE